MEYVVVVDIIMEKYLKKGSDDMNLNIDCATETERIVKFIQDTFKSKGFNKAVIGISGGIDSAVVAALLVKALGKENVLGYILPYGKQKDFIDARSIFDVFDIYYDVVKEGYTSKNEIDIKEIVDRFPCMTDNKRIGNIMARVRMIILFDKSAKHNALVVGTGNKTELTLGYFTLHGDGACALLPIGHLYKTQVRQLAKYLGVPQNIIDKAPTAGLWEGQTDEGEFGATYEEIDEILYRFDHDAEFYSDIFHVYILHKKGWEIQLVGQEKLAFELVRRIAVNSFKRNAEVVTPDWLPCIPLDENAPKDIVGESKNI